MRVAMIIPKTNVDGMGTRASLYVQGCHIRCKGCQNPHMFDPDGGQGRTVASVVEELLNTGQKRLTVLGGEPTEQALEVAQVLFELRYRGWNDICLYTGRVYEDLLETFLIAKFHDMHVLQPNGVGIFWLFGLVDTLVDGPYKYEEDDPFLQWRGSRNQRVIDLRAMREAGDFETIITKPEWDAPTVIIQPGGVVKGAAGLIELLVADRPGEVVHAARRCGQGHYRGEA